MLARILLLVVIAGCNKAAPPKQTDPVPPPQPSSIDAAEAMAAIDAEVVAAADAGAAPVDAAAAAGVDEEVEGIGKCKKDDDCVLTAWQDSCCTQSCQSHAENKLDLAKREAKANCAVKKPSPCPPPAPCPARTHQVLSAKCKNKQCYTVQRKLGPGGVPTP